MVYSLIFTSILIVILIVKLYILLKNKRNSGDYEKLDIDFISKLNEGETSE